MNDDILIRDFTESDLDGMLAIFNYFAEISFAVYSNIPFTTAHIKKIAEEIKIGLVVEMGNKMIGFGYISPFKPFPNFNNTGLLTYFILPGYTGKGVGTRLFEELISRGKEIGITNYLANISSKNQQSLSFHKKMGFEEVGNFKNVAAKFNEPFDMIWVQKQYNG
jgi:phosphinothricin acetyltransferase